MSEKKYVLFHGNELVVEEKNDNHGLAIYTSSPLGKRMLHTDKDNYVIDKFEDASGEEVQGLTFEALKISGTGSITPCLNVGKEWVFR